MCALPGSAPPRLPCGVIWASACASAHRPSSLLDCLIRCWSLGLLLLLRAVAQRLVQEPIPRSAGYRAFCGGAWLELAAPPTLLSGSCLSCFKAVGRL